MFWNLNCRLVYWYQTGAKNHSKTYNQWQIYIVKLWMRTILPVQLSIFHVVIRKFWQNNKLPTCLLFGIGTAPLPRLQKIWQFYQEIEFTETRIEITGVVLQFCIKKQRNKALFSENKALFLKNKALLRIKVWVNFIFIFQNLLLNHFYCMLFSSWVLVFPLTICFII